MNIERSAVAAVVISSLFAAGWCAARAQTGRTWANAQVSGKQVVLVFHNRTYLNRHDVDIVSVNKDSTVYMGLVPLDHQAVLSPSTYMVCHAYTELLPQPLEKSAPPAPGEVQRAGLTTNIGFVCGGARYSFESLDIQ